MFNLVAFYESQAQDAALDNVTPVQDALVTISANNRVIFPMDYLIGAVHVVGDAISRARINTPSFRMIGLPEIYPIKPTVAVGANPPIMGPMWGQMRIPSRDEVGIDTSRGGSGAGGVWAALFVSDRFTPANVGPIYPMRFTASVTLTVGTWVPASLVFDQALPYGRYAVVGMHCVCNDGVYARLTFPGNTQYRPGVVVVEAVGEYVNPQMFRMGNFGKFGEFDSTAAPGLEFLGDTAGVETPSGILDLIKIS